MTLGVAAKEEERGPVRCAALAVWRMVYFDAGGASSPGCTYTCWFYRCVRVCGFS